MKRTLAMLLCLAMLLSFVPATIFSVSAENVDPEHTDIEIPIVPDDEVEETTGATEPAPETSEAPEAPARVAYCAACGQEVTWTAVANGDIIGGNGHYYLTENCTYTALLPVISVAAGKNACVDLNGFDLDTTAEINVKGTLNIQGEGNVGGAIGYVGNKEDVDFDDLVNAGQGNAATFDAALFNIAAGAVVNIYGGTYAVTNDKPIVVANGALNVLGGEIAGTVNAADLTLGGAAKITKIEAANLTVKADWTGTAVISAAVLETGAAEGDFTGALTTVDGDKVINAGGKLAIYVPVVMTGITVTAPTKVEYELGEELVLDGMTVTGVYSDETTAPIAEGFTVTGFDSETAGVKTITVTYGEFTATFEVTVKAAAAVITGIEVTTLPTKLTYMVGASFDAKGMVISAVYSDGSKVEISDYTVNVDLATAGTKTVTITSGEFTTTFTVEVLANVDITMTATNAATGVALNWTAEGATSFVVYERHLVDGVMSDWTLLKSVTATTYTHTAAEVGTAYEYKLVAKNGEVVVGEAYSSITRVAATTITVANALTGVQVTWEADAAATAYRVYRRAYVNNVPGEWVQLAEVTETGYLDETTENGMKYGYVVRTVIGEDEGPESTEVGSVYFDVTIVTAENTGSGIKLKWSANTADGVKYYIYRSEYKAGEWSAYKRLKSHTELTYTDTTVTNGVLYRFDVRAFKGTQIAAESSGTQHMRLTVPAVSATNQTAGMQLTWKKNAAAEVYDIYRSAYNADGTSNPWGRPILTVGADVLEYMDTTAENGVRYRYTVRARNGEYVSAFKDSPSAKLYRLERTNILSITNEVSFIAITWETNEVAAKYAVYRSEKAAGATSWSAWTRMTYVQRPDTLYKDYDVVAGTTYRYRITTMKDTDQSSALVSENIMRIGSTAISLAAYTGRMRITIKANALAENYTIQRRVTGTGEWITLAENITGDDYYWDNTTEAGVTYEYRANANANGYTCYSKAYSATAK